ncbi:hypothetical protein [Microbacterium rhizophilus]|uniref:hypothetical protein n=1 Tax=Microbacterium rhizophilus TaxID=3138934 RepID=UPI0031E8A7FB
MLIGKIRPQETRELTAEGESLEAIAAGFRAQTPAGWELLQQHAELVKGSTQLAATATIARWGEVQEIEGDDMPALEAKVPAGWRLLSVRRV